MYMSFNRYLKFGLPSFVMLALYSLGVPYIEYLMAVATWVATAIFAGGSVLIPHFSNDSRGYMDQMVNGMKPNSVMTPWMLVVSVVIALFISSVLITHGFFLTLIAQVSNVVFSCYLQYKARQ